MEPLDEFKIAKMLVSPPNVAYEQKTIQTLIKFQYEKTKKYLAILLLVHALLVCLPLQLYLSTEERKTRLGYS